MRLSSIIAVIAVLLSFTLASTSIAQEDDVPTKISIGLSNDTVPISSDFDGTEIVIFGSIDNVNPLALKDQRYDVVVALFGPKEEVVVRRKEHKLGIWVNGKSMRFSDVPSSYSVATTRPLTEIRDSNDKRILQIGLDNLNVVPETSFDETNEAAVSEAAEFRQSLSRLKVSQRLYRERIGGVKFIGRSTLFKATLAVPANVPIGQHTARAFLFLDGTFVDSHFSQMQVKKIGFEQFAYSLAYENGLLYGILAVFIAIATGWFASIVFRKD